MIDFSKMLRAEECPEIVEKRRLIDSYCAMDDATLGTTLLNLARKARSEIIANKNENIEVSLYDESQNFCVSELLWTLLPDMAKELGSEEPLDSHEQEGFLYKEKRLFKSHEQKSFLYEKEYLSSLRKTVTTYLRELSNYNALPKNDTLPACDILSNDVSNGNIIEIALNRLAQASLYYDRNIPYDTEGDIADDMIYYIVRGHTNLRDKTYKPEIIVA